MRMMINTFRSIFLYILFTTVFAIEPAIAANFYCKQLFNKNSFSSDAKILDSMPRSNQKTSSAVKQSTQELADSLVKIGANSLTAFRIATHYPNLGLKILNKKNIQWVTLYRGLNIPSISHLNPNLYRFTGGGNLRPNLIKIFFPEQGFYMSSDINEALVFSRSELYTDKKNTVSILLEIQIPSFLLDSSFVLSDTATFLHRKYSPELDLWISRYSETHQDYDKSNPSTIHSYEWKSYEDLYFAKHNTHQQTGYFVKFMKYMYELNHRLSNFTH